MIVFATINSGSQIETQYSERLVVSPRACAAARTRHGYWQTRLSRSTIALVLLICSSKVCLSQSATPPAVPEEAEVSRELTDGLLELLVEPAPNKETTLPPKKMEFRPEDLNMEGEDLGESSENPLRAVRQSMMIASAFVKNGSSPADTLQLQTDIVQRLDDIIRELEKSQSKSSQGQSNEKTQTQNQSQQSAQQLSEREKRRARQAVSKGDSSQESRDGTGSQVGDPSVSGQEKASARDAKVQLADPRSLQQNVWGQLPQRVREQMQSRMVEQFLPAYREQIEAYFQALMK